MRRDGPSLIPPGRNRRRRLGLAGLAFLLTCVSVFVVNLPRWPGQGMLSWETLWASTQFTLILMAILGAHELGHLAAARMVGIRTGPPWFVPFPWLVGTMGAIIVPAETPRERTGLALMAASGPLAGASVVLCVLAVAGVGRFSGGSPSEFSLAAPPVIAVAQWLSGHTSGVASNDPVGLALWIGCAVTWVNLMPFGQLDGGHLWSSFFPDYALHATWATTLMLFGLAWWWPPWLVWMVVLHIVGNRRPSDLRRPELPIRRPAAVAGLGCVVLFVACAVPCPW